MTACRRNRHKPRTLRRRTEDERAELTVPQKSRRGTPSSMVRRSSRSVMAAQWGTGKMPGGGVKVDRSCTSQQRQPQWRRHNQNPTLLSLSTRHPGAFFIEVQHAGMLHALSRPCGQIAAPMGPPQPWGFPWLAWHPLWPRVCLSCSHGCLPVRPRQSVRAQDARQSRLLPAACKPPHCGQPCSRQWSLLWGRPRTSSGWPVTGVQHSVCRLRRRCDMRENCIQLHPTAPMVCFRPPLPPRSLGWAHCGRI